MKTLRIVLGILAIIPIGLLIDNIFFHPIPPYFDDFSIRTLIYHAIGIPILFLNIYVWGIYYVENLNTKN